MRSLTPDARRERRAEVVRLRKTGLTYLQIGTQTGLSRTGVFDICKRYAATGSAAFKNATASRPSGAVRKLLLPQESMLRELICKHTPDQLDMPYALWTRAAASSLIASRLGLRLKVRTLGSYLTRWGFSPRKSGRHAWDLSAAGRLWLRDEYPYVAARALVEDADVHWGEDAPLRGHAGETQSSGHGVVDVDRQLGLTSTVNSKGQVRWKVHVGVLTAGDLIGFLRRLVRNSPKKIFLMLHDTPAQKAPSVEVWLVEHVDEIEVFCQPAQDARSAGARVALATVDSAA